MSDRLGVGDAVVPREWTTIRGGSVRLPGPKSLTHLQFRRFSGCPICNVHLRSVAQRYDEITAAGISELLVFHSNVQAMRLYQERCRSPPWRTQRKGRDEHLGCPLIS